MSNYRWFCFTDQEDLNGLLSRIKYAGLAGHGGHIYSRTLYGVYRLVANKIDSDPLQFALLAATGSFIRVSLYGIATGKAYTVQDCIRRYRMADQRRCDNEV